MVKPRKNIRVEVDHLTPALGPAQLRLEIIRYLRLVPKRRGLS